MFRIVIEAILNLANLLLQFLLKIPLLFSLLFKNQLFENGFILEAILLIAIVEYLLVPIVYFRAGGLAHCNFLLSHLLLHLLLLDVLK